MIITVLDYNIGNICYYKYNSDDCSNEAVLNWLIKTYGYREDDISFMITKKLQYYIDPSITKNEIDILNE